MYDKFKIPNFFFLSWRQYYRKEGYAQSKLNVSLKVEPFKTKKEVSIDSRGKSDTQTLHNHNIKCF